jgi:hypothetical protein
MGCAWLVEPLYQALRNEPANWLCCVTSVVKIIQVDGEKACLQCMAIWMGTAKDVGILFMDPAAVWASVVFWIVVAMHFMSCWKPAVEMF